MISLKSISKENWRDAINLEVHEEQKDFIASNTYSIAQVQFLEDFKAMGVYLEDKMIGFAMYGIDEDDHHYWIYRLMIQKELQGKGYGLKALQEVIKDIKQNNLMQKPHITIGYHPENEGARHTYKKVGFVETEIAPWGEQLALLKI